MPLSQVPQNQVRNREVGQMASVHATSIRILLGVVLTALVIGTCTIGARAGDDDDGDATSSSSFMDKFMRTLGLKNPGTMEYGINYSERSPLVVPPTRDLPPPVADVPPSNPDWPKDADIRKRHELKADKKVSPHIDYVVESSRPLRPDELNRPNPPGANPGPGTPSSSTAQQGQTSLEQGTKRSIFDLNWFKSEQYATFTGEPPRSSLTDPPPGYLTPSPDQPYGISEKQAPEKQQTLGERMEVQR